MRNGLFLLVALGLVGVGCADADTTSGSGGGSTSSTTTSTTNTGGSTSGTGGSTTTTSGTGGGTTTGTGGSGPDSCLDDTVQLLISEIATQPGPAEFFEVYNPSAQAVDVTDYYISDNSIYYAIADGTAWNPMGTPGTDFLVQFPAGTTIPSGEVVTIESGDLSDFFTTYGSCPDFTLRSGVTCNGSPVPQMKIPATVGGVAATSNLSNDGEMLVLFCFGGGNVVHDVDYVTWDDDLTDLNTHVLKTGKPGYSADTAIASQSLAPKPAVAETIARCTTTETGETMTGGNGLLGHDETSETLATSFTIETAPTPGSPTCN